MISELIMPLRRLAASQLLGQVAVVGAVTVGVKLVAFSKELVVAQKFGTSDAVDAFVLALMVPTILAFIVGDAFHDSAIPAYAEQKANRGKRPDRLIANAVWCCGGVLLIATVAIGVFGKPLVGLLAGNFSPAKQEMSVGYLWLLFPFATCLGVGTVFRGYLQSHGWFAVSSSARGLIPFVTIAVLLIAPAPTNPALLGIGASVGALLLFLWLGGLSAKVSKGRVWQRPSWDPAASSMVGNALPLILGCAIMEGCFFVDTMMAASLPAGSVATLSYGERVCSIVLVVTSTAAGQVLFPHVSKLVAAQAWRPLSQVVFRFCAVGLVATLPFVAFFGFASEPVVRLLLERGQFTAEDTLRVAAVLQFAGFQIPGYILAVLGTRVVLALKGGKFLLVTTACGLALNVGLNLLFIRWFGVKGIALSTAVVALFSAAMLFSYFALRVRKLSETTRANENGETE